MEKIAVLDFGGQYTHLLARRIRQLGVYSVIVDPQSFVPSNEIGLIFSGGPRSVTEANKLSIPFEIETFKKPILGICYGHQLLAALMGGIVEAGHTREYGLASLEKANESILFASVSKEFNVWMSHGDHVSQLPTSCKTSASSPHVHVAAFEDSQNERYGVQFHPEVVHTQFGTEILRNFVKRCNPKSQWTPRNRIQELIKQTRAQIQNRKALLLLSGGVDSLVAWAICHQALPKENLVAIHVDTGLMRKNESKSIMRVLADANFTNMHLIRAENSFLDALKGICDPEEKRKIIGTKFVEIANQAITELFANDNDVMLIQGTIYPDTIESGGTKNAAKIKTHHNRVDAIQQLINEGRVCEPLAELYKDEVREVGMALGLPAELVMRHPFPGPGLGVRLLCATEDEACNQQSIESICGHNELETMAQKFGFHAKILPIKSVGVQGDGRTYAHPGMLWTNEKPQEQQDNCSNENKKDKWKQAADCARQAINEIPNINRVVVSLTEVDNDLCIVACDMNQSRLNVLREVDAVATRYCVEEPKIWQAPVVGLPLQNKQGEWAFVIRPVRSIDGMTADFFPLSDAALNKMVQELKSISGVGPIFYDVTSKPPATIEWE